jgi:hypothetical protein
MIELETGLTGLDDGGTLDIESGVAFERCATLPRQGLRCGFH